MQKAADSAPLSTGVAALAACWAMHVPTTDLLCQMVYTMSSATAHAVTQYAWRHSSCAVLTHCTAATPHNDMHLLVTYVMLLITNPVCYTSHCLVTFPRANALAKTGQSQPYATTGICRLHQWQGSQRISLAATV